MRILMITPYVTITTRSEFIRNKTGFGYMVMDIAKAVGQLEQVEVLAYNTIGAAFEYGEVKFLKRSLGLYLRSVLLCLPFSELCDLKKRYDMMPGSFIRLFYYWIMTGFVKKSIRKGQYDVVHIHGCGFATELWMKVCRKNGQKFVVTLHGLNSFSSTVGLEPAGKFYEREFLRQVTLGLIPITVISTGMKNLIEDTYNVKDCKGISVVCNSFSFMQEHLTISIRDKYKIPNDAKILLYVGNISKNKNQIQMVRAFGLLPDELRKKTYVLFCGEDSLRDGELERGIDSCLDGDHLILCGCVEKAKIADYYREADGVVLLSLSEGFGLSLVEGMHFGLPCVMPNDLDAFEDIYNECAVVPIKGRDDMTVSKAIEILLSRAWNNESIKAYSNRFDQIEMASKYIKVYNTIVHDEIC